MLGYICVEERGEADRILTALAARLRARLVRVAGAVQTNDPWRDDMPCDMNLHVLPADPEGEAEVIRISERLGKGAEACRLDIGALEEAAALVEARIAGAELLILNKFGKREAAGGGFRAAVARALEAGVPVLIAAGPVDSIGFLDFAGDMAERVAPEAAEAWALAAAGRAGG